MTQPFTPDQAIQAAKQKRISNVPPFVVNAVNSLLAEKVDSRGYANITQDEIIDRIIEIMPELDRHMIFEREYLEIEDLFRQAGWDVEYDKPAYFESYTAFFIFKRSK